MILFQILMATLVGVLLSGDNHDVIRKLLLFVIVQIVYYCTIQSLPLTSAFDFYTITSVIQILIFATLFDYRSNVIEKSANFIVILFLVADVIFTWLYFPYLSDLWVSYINHFKGDMFLMWILAVVVGSNHREHLRESVIVLLVWWLSGEVAS